MDLYVPILVLAVVAGGFAIFSVAIAPFTGPKRWNRAKLDAYECGIEPTPQPVGGGRFPLKYMVTAMLFIVFDIEIIFLYPWAVSFAPLTNDAGQVIASGLGVFALVEMLLFIVTVLVAYAYVWRRKGLEWD
jgi:NADH-quinone oxidoreductase subunit A